MHIYNVVIDSEMHMHICIEKLLYNNYGTARFKLQERTRLQLHAHDTSTEILITC